MRAKVEMKEELACLSIDHVRDLGLSLCLVAVTRSSYHPKCGRKSGRQRNLYAMVVRI